MSSFQLLRDQIELSLVSFLSQQILLTLPSNYLQPKSFHHLCSSHTGPSHHDTGWMSCSLQALSFRSPFAPLESTLNRWSFSYLGRLIHSAQSWDFSHKFKQKPEPPNGGLRFLTSSPSPPAFALSSPATLDPSLIFPTQGLGTCYFFHLGMFFPPLPLGLLLHLLLVGWYSNILTALLKNFNPPMTCYVRIWYIDTLCIYWTSVFPSANDHHRLWILWHQRYDSFIQWCTVSGRTHTWHIHGHAPPPPKYWQNEELITNISKICS